MARGIDPTTYGITHCDECPPSEFDWAQHNTIDENGPVLLCRTHGLGGTGAAYDHATAGSLDKCWRHDYDHREYVCTCTPPVEGDTGREPIHGMCTNCGAVEVALNSITGYRDLSGIGEHERYPYGYGCEVCS